MSVIQSVDLTVLAPVLIVAVGALVALLADLLVPSVRWLAGAVALVAVVAPLSWLPDEAATGLRTLCVVNGQCSFATGRLTAVLQGLVLVGAALVVLMSWAAVEELNLPIGEYYFLLLCSVAGAVALPATRDLVSLLVVLEVVTLPTIALVALRRDRSAAPAALQMFLFAIVSLAVSLYGLALVYGSTGHVDLASLAVIARDPAHRTATLGVGIALILAVLLFKVAAVPFNAWAPDTYAGAPIPIAAYLSVVSKIAGFSGLILVAVTFAGWWPVWSGVLAVVAALTMLVANLAALRQHSAVRLLAWSSIAQAGYVLVPLAALVGGTSGSARTIAAMVGYLAVYLAMNLGAFAIVALVARNGGPQRLTEYNGLAWRHPVEAVALAFFLACLAGLPPGLAGLFVKVAVLAEPASSGAWWLALIMGVATVIGLAYYLAWGARLFRRPEAGVATLRRGGAWGTRIAAGVALGAAIGLSVVPSLALGLLPG
jgi:NADH-quinone oxidoreductase subunit N